MKNLFKNLMLVAVAAMAFTACAETNDEVNAVVKKTVINGVAMIDADNTRSGFVGSETTKDENDESVTVYKSAWDGGETIKLFAENGLATTATVDAEGKFTAEFEGELPESFFMTVCSPAEAWSDATYFTIPAEQTPRAESVDPAAHIFKAQNVQVTNGTADKIQMGHEVAYGKMTVNGVDFKIDHVVIDLKGSYYNNVRELSYIINADNVVNNTFWFATEPIDVAEFTVTAYDADNAVAKTVDVAAAGKTLSFNYGRVSTFSVSGLETPAEKYDSTYAYVYQDYGANDKEIVFIADDNRALRIDFFNVYDDNCIVPGTYTFEGDGRMYPSWCYYYADANYDYTTKLTNGQAVVTFEDGEYKIVFTNMSYEDVVYVENFTFKGLIEGLDVPDPRIKLDAPNVTSQISGKTIILDWDPVTGADSYTIVIYSDAETVEPVSTTETHFEYTVKNYDSYYSFKVTAVVAEDDAEYRNSGYAGYAEYTDPREQLPAPTNVTATVVGLNVTITWDKVDNAVGYEINYYDNGNITKSTTETSITLEMSTYNYEYWFYLSSIADENSDSHRSSDKYDASVTAKTDKDPNVVLTADYTATNIIWNNSEQRFEFIGADLQYFYIKMNAEDRPNNNSFAVGEYTGIGSRDVGVKQFSVSQKVNISVGWTDTSNASTMSIEVKNGEYVIYIAYVAAYNQGAFTLMYKGLPDGFVLPDGTGGGGETPEPELPTIKDQYNVTWSYELDSSSSGVYGHLWTVTSGDGGFYAKVGTDSNCTTPTSFTPGEYEYHTQFADGPSGPGFTMRSIQIEGVEYSNNNIDGKMVVAIENGAYAITIDLYKKADGSKITTLVGIFGSADSGSGDNTGDGDNTGGGGDTPTEDFSNWNYGAVINTSSGVVTLTDKTGNGRVVEFKLNEVAMTTFYSDTTRSNYFTDVKVDGVAATATPESWFKFARSGYSTSVEINMVINGVTYTGVAASLSY